MSSDFTLGIDIGGANLKYADTNGQSRCAEFPLWLRPDDLAAQLARDISRFRDAGQIVATMTGELADCFLDRAVGVGHIVEQLCRATRKCGLPDPKFYAVDGRFHSAATACENVDEVAASNWHALASFVAREFASGGPQGGLLLDIGSTTSDLVPLRDGAVETLSRTDFDRLAEGTLVYLGGGRTPVCSLVHSLRHEGCDVGVMREVFATMDDVRLLMGFQPADASDCRTADGKPRDVFHAANRMARMIGLDHRTVGVAEATMLARQVHGRARDTIGLAIAALDAKYQLGPRSPMVLSGHCSDLLPPDAESGRERISLGHHFGAEISRAAPAYAVAKLFTGLKETVFKGGSCDA